MKTKTIYRKLLTLLFFQNFIICAPIFANNFSCDSFFPRSQMNFLRPDPSHSSSVGIVERLRNLRKYFLGSSKMNSPPKKKVDILENLREYMPNGFELTLKSQIFPVEILGTMERDSGSTNISGVRVWIDSDLGLAHVHLRVDGRIKISLSAYMSNYLAERTISYDEIINRVKESSKDLSEDINMLYSHNFLLINHGSLNEGIIIDGDPSNPENGFQIQVAAQRVTQAIVDFIEGEHQDLKINDQKTDSYIKMHAVHRERVQHIQSELGLLPLPVANVSEHIWKEERVNITGAPRSSLKYSLKIDGIGEISMFLNYNVFSPSEFESITFNKIENKDRLPNEDEIRRFLGGQSNFTITSESTDALTVEFGVILNDDNTFSQSERRFTNLVSLIKKLANDKSLTP